MKTIEDYLKTELGGFTPNIERLMYMPYQMDLALKVIAKLGEKHIGGAFRIDDQNRFVIENLIKWAHGDTSMQCKNPVTKEVIDADVTKGIYIAGPTGTGKTILTKILSDYMTIDNVMMKVNGVSYKNMVYSSFSTHSVCDYYAANGELYPFLQRAVICFQDLGVEQQETLFMGTRTKVMQTIIQERGDARGVITLFTSNNGIEDEDNYKLYGDRGVSRLNKMCNYFELVGLDRRKK